MPDYVNVPIEVDDDALAQDAFDYLETELPGYEANPGALDVILLEATSRMAAEAAEVASDVPTSIFRYLGASLFGLPPVSEAPASALATFTARNAAGYTLPAGTAVAVRATGDVEFVFLSDAEVVIPPGQTSTAVGGVTLVADDAGTAPNGAAAGVVLVDALEWVDTVTLVAPPSGGVDAESDDDYLAHLTAELRLLAPRPILPDDFAVLAHRVPAVGRAVALDGYDPSDGSTGHERTVTVAVVGDDGEPVGPQALGDVDTLLTARREVNFIVHVVDPSYTAVHVTTTVRALPDYSADEVDAAVTAALALYLSPGQWGVPIERGARGDSATLGSGLWRNVTAVRYLELAEVINRVEGVDYVQTLTFAVGAGAPGTADSTLPGAAPLPRPGVLDVTAVLA